MRNMDHHHHGHDEHTTTITINALGEPCDHMVDERGGLPDRSSWR
jgi:hypothetical protein